MKKRWWSIFNGTLAGYFFEFRLFRESMNLVATGVAFCGGGEVRVVVVVESVPE